MNKPPHLYSDSHSNPNISAPKRRRFINHGSTLSRAECSGLKGSGFSVWLAFTEVIAKVLWVESLGRDV